MSSPPPAWLLLPAAREAAAQQRYGALLRLARTAAGLTPTQAGQFAGYSAATLSRLERGVQPLTDVRVLRRLASVLAIPPDMFGLDHPHPPPARPLGRLRWRTKATQAREARCGDGSSSA